MLEHRAGSLEVAALNLDGVSTDATGGLRHLQVQTVDDASFGCIGIEGFLSLGHVEFTKLNRTEREGTRALFRDGNGEVCGVVKVQIAILGWSGRWFLLLFLLSRSLLGLLALFGLLGLSLGGSSCQKSFLLLGGANDGRSGLLDTLLIRLDFTF